MNTAKRIYLCGPASGRPGEECAYQFDAAAAEIRRRAEKEGLGTSAFDPVRYCKARIERGAPWHIFMRACLPRLIECGGIGLLQGWEKSRGARLEHFVAGELKIPVVYLEPPVDAFALSLLHSGGRSGELARYFQSRYAQCVRKGYSEEFSEECAAYETANRYLDPHGFEYLDEPSKEENYGQV
jgi:hypothetical protein